MIAKSWEEMIGNVPVTKSGHSTYDLSSRADRRQPSLIRSLSPADILDLNSNIYYHNFMLKFVKAVVQNLFKYSLVAHDTILKISGRYVFTVTY
jgi:hypothetical protein